MNRLLLGAALLAAGCLPISCTKDATQQPDALHTVTRRVTIEAGMTSTRTELAPDGYNVLWSPGDTIGVYVKSGETFTTLNAPLTFAGAEAAANGRFGGEITLTEGAPSYTLYAYYPYRKHSSPDAAAVPFTLAVQQRQTAAGTSTHLGDSDFLVAGSVTSVTEDFPALVFRHAFAVIEVALTGSAEMAGKQLSSVALFATDAASVDSSGNLTDMANMAGDFVFDLTAATSNNMARYTGGSAQMGYCMLTFDTAPILGTTPVKTYLTVNPADYSRGDGRLYAVVRTLDGYTATFSRPGLAIAAGQMKVITQDVAAGTEPQPTVDLSEEGTANCYIATVPEQEYSFDATVAGNGVITTGLSEAVQRFEGRTLSAAVSGSDARLVWQSRPYLIEPGSIRCEGGRIYFTLTQRPTVLGGNAVIGLYPDAASDEAVWSWHIWITDNTNQELAAQAETYVLYETYETLYGAGSTQMMDRNLGAIYKEDNAYARSFRAPLYQWGRKDPFPWGKTIYDEQSVPITYILAYKPVQTSGEKGQYAGYTGNTRYATAHPEIFIATTPQSSYDWCYGGGAGNGPDYRNNELWGNPTGYTAGQNTTKTLFDPCPPGWKMPNPYVFSSFFRSDAATATVSDGQTTATGTFVQGWNFLYNGSDATYYPGVGYRYDEFGIFSFQPSGYYWTSAPAPPSAFQAWAFGMTNTSISQRFADPRGFGLPVRCMRDRSTP